MRTAIFYANIAKYGKVVYDPLNGIAQKFAAKETTENEDIIVVNEIKKFLSKNEGEIFTFIIPRNLAAPTFQAMKVINTIILKIIKEGEEEDVDTYLTNLAAANIDPSKVDPKDIKQILRFVKAAMNNTWTDPVALDYILELALTSDHKFMTLENDLKPVEEGKILSQVSKNRRKLVEELVNVNCAIPEMKEVIVKDDEEENTAPEAAAQ